MEKLVKLLNEYHFSWTEYIWYFLDEEENSGVSYSEASKSIGISSTVIFNSVKILERKWYIKKDNWKVLVIK